jgi:YD repeat-containing protein
MCAFPVACRTAAVRTSKVETVGGDRPVTRHFAYDIDDNQVFATDGEKIASAAAFDVFSRPVESLASDRTRSTVAYDPLGRAKETTELGRDGSLLSSVTMHRTAAGKLRQVDEQLGALGTRTSKFVWDGAGRTNGGTRGLTTLAAASSSASTNPLADARSWTRTFDEAGRLRESRAGAGSAREITDAYSRSAVSYGSGFLSSAQTWSDRSGASVTSTISARDTLGNATAVETGRLSSRQSFDQAGNLVSATPPGRGTTTYARDGRGALVEQILPGGASVQHQYGPLGNAKQYLDQVAEPTDATADQLGRPRITTYADGTYEETVWDGPRIKATRDREGRWLSFLYDDEGRLLSVWRGAEPGGGVELKRYGYDTAGRLTEITTGEAKIEFADFELDGLPRVTRQTRYAGGGGLTGSLPVDSYEQRHDWNVHGERIAMSMPAPAGSELPLPWTRWLRFGYDAAGNQTSVVRADGQHAEGALVADATFRGEGRPAERSVFPAPPACSGTTCAGAPVVRHYDYEEGTGLLNEMRVSAGGVTVGGARVAFDGLQIATSRLLGVSGGARFNHWSYDPRGRLAGAVYGTADGTPIDPAPAVPGAARETLSPADFRQASERTPRIGGGERELLAARGVSVEAIDPTGAVLTESARGHTIESVTQGGSRRRSPGRVAPRCGATGGSAMRSTTSGGSSR